AKTRHQIFRFPAPVWAGISVLFGNRRRRRTDVGWDLNLQTGRQSLSCGDPRNNVWILAAFPGRFALPAGVGPCEGFRGADYGYRWHHVRGGVASRLGNGSHRNGQRCRLSWHEDRAVDRGGYHLRDHQPDHPGHTASPNRRRRSSCSFCRESNGDGLLSTHNHTDCRCGRGACGSTRLHLRLHLSPRPGLLPVIRAVLPPRSFPGSARPSLPFATASTTGPGASSGTSSPSTTTRFLADIKLRHRRFGISFCASMSLCCESVVTSSD